MAQGATHRIRSEQCAAVADRGGTGRERRRAAGGSRRRQEPHEVCESDYIRGDVSRRPGREAGMVFRGRVKQALLLFFAFLLEQLVCYSLLHVIGFARKNDQRFVLGLPPEARDSARVTFAVFVPANSQRLLGGGVQQFVCDDRGIFNPLNKTGPEHRGRNPEDDVGRKRSEVGLRNSATGGVGSAGNDEQVMNTPVSNGVCRGIREFESHLAHREWEVPLNKRRHRIGCSILRCYRHLRIHERAGSADRGLRMAACATVQIESRPQSSLSSLNRSGDGLHFLKLD